MITLERLEVSNFKSIRSLLLEFPGAGAILVEGRNESGKSTLFESIYFGLYGAPIVTEDNKGALGGLITYGESTARVGLRLRASGRELCIERVLRSGRSTTAALTLDGPGEERERITGVRAVNARVVEELGGLDGPALLNSCFVEQKKLAKLEDLDARERRDSLLRILNLDRLSQLEDEYRVRASDEARLRLAEDRLRLATITAEMEALRREIEDRRTARAHIERARRLLELRNAEIAREVAENRARGLERLRSLESAQEASTLQRELQGSREEIAKLRARRPQVLLGGVAGVLALLLLGLVALAAGAGPVGILPLVGALGVAALVARKFTGMAARIRSLEADLPRKRALLASSQREVEELRSGLGLASPVETEGELRLAYQRLGAAEGSVDLARRAMQAQEDGSPTSHVLTGLTGDAHLNNVDGTGADPERELLDLEAEWRQLAGRLEADPGALDIDGCEREYADTKREIEIKRRAGVILAEARRRIVSRVLPETERNMKLILPMLTSGRYHDARITEDYRISVWDESAGRYVGKNVFSGGAQDGFSLALRLAFAIASLPQELGASPGFLFMDEPLSSFDDERTRALIELVTRGELAAIFPQICIISHSKSFDPSAFPYVIQMDSGRIGYTNL